MIYINPPYFSNIFRFDGDIEHLKTKLYILIRRYIKSI